MNALPIDVVIAEVKSGNDNKPNRVWRDAKPNQAITYIARFVVYAPTQISARLWSPSQRAFGMKPTDADFDTSCLLQ